MVVRLASSILSGLAATVHMAKHHFGAMVNNWRLAYCCIYPILAMCQVSGVCVKVARLKEGGEVPAVTSYCVMVLFCTLGHLSVG